MNQLEDINHILGSISESIKFILPELILSASIFILIIAELFRRQKGRWIFVLILAAGLFTSLFFTAAQFAQLGSSGFYDGFDGLIRLDGVSVFFRILFIVAGILFLIMTLNDRTQFENQAVGEYYIIFLGILLGSCFLISSINLLSIYISIELISISSYLITVFNFNRKSLESGLKYLLFGALASGIMLYGISLLYGFTGTLQITDPEFLATLQQVPRPALIVSLLLTVSGLLFKMSIIPFHLWTPDVYEGAPTPLVAFFSVVPKLAGLVAFTRVYYLIQSEGSVQIEWELYFGIIAILTITLGNLIAIWQKDAKRMMAYSSISHSGIFLIGVIVFDKSGFDAIMFYAVVYLFMNFLVFYVVQLLNNEFHTSRIEDYKGLSSKVPVLSVMILIGLISLTGLPPTAGFTGKLLIFSSAWNKYQLSGSNILSYMVVFGLINTIISLFYYLKIPYYMYFKPGGRSPVQKVDYRNVIFVTLMTFPLLIIFFKPDWLLELINTISFTF